MVEILTIDEANEIPDEVWEELKEIVPTGGEIITVSTKPTISQFAELYCNVKMNKYQCKIIDEVV